MDDTLIKKRLIVEERPLRRFISKCHEFQNNELDIDDLEVECAAMEAVWTRLQLQSETNENESRVYQKRVEEIEKECEEETKTIEELLKQMEATKEDFHRKEQYDNIAKMITSKDLRSPEEQQQLVTKLNDAIEELQKEKESYTSLWDARNASFEEILKQIQSLKEQIHPTVSPTTADDTNGMQEEGEHPDA
ncbi:THO complex subunit 7 [Schizosaccharomyces japonicus yFS275]|uniref:THO complex subunit 7 n=1 Tax=Schizosaccharomyces japonicus (strain yFS275 / FY16936) TaxID=402676 RepID=B6K674_SCHJY|nr:THO complex subunit 7 [Schizosaccharomyces japonicus yFS275]EEB09028.1 THO complex subunit 7 [Schizosaccharomyces japonicus yFS275]